ncbi:tyrosine-type recombinase/integrase [Pontiella sulfatireligans]|uniref:Tyr recombinase domain-containing protein n=1 Tax=Pontiella sulfatireligans TaxID=2750658 RepID=A0A6C2URS1_9BACT|nr:tyrosine-type recombinase/integrase [Pontiella sulfatireligans]VGO21954.1 hypothetical protein SCARR_04034 [Pontiella sulfatireligans]
MIENGKIKGTLERRKTSKWWYGAYKVGGKRKAVNLHVEIRGTPPGKLEEHGSIQFEKSKGEAEAALKALLADVNGNRKTEELAQAVHEARTGRRIASYTLADLPMLWESMPRNKTPSNDHIKRCTDILTGFVTFCSESFPNISNLDHLAPDHAHAYMDWQEKRGINPRTWNFILAAMKAACRRGDCRAFDDMKQKPLETVHRVPFTPDELQAILTAAKADNLVYPLVVTATCTAMRKGDCCRLRWDAVDLISGYITVKTSKTGRTADIPLADLLREEIEKQTGNESDYVFPELAKQYANDDTLLTKRFKAILARAGFNDGTSPPAELKAFDPKELAEKAEAYFCGIQTSKKREKARATFAAYIAGKSLAQSAEAAGVSKATGSAYLNEIETETGIAFIRGKRRENSAPTPSRGNVSLERETGLRRASVRDFHALRTTWITLALMNGMPLELVQTVTGHATAEIVMQHYFKPQREQLKTAMHNYLPDLLSNSRQPVNDSISHSVKSSS